MKTTALSIVILTIATLMLGHETAYAANRYGIACIYNRTATTINYAIQVGDGAWNAYSIAPGGNRRFSHTYDRQNENRSPDLRVRFDSDLRQGRFNITYKLQRRATQGQSCAEGKAYAFQYEPNNRSFIDLKAVR